MLASICSCSKLFTTESADSVFCAVLLPHAAKTIAANDAARIDNFFICFLNLINKNI
jgi:hypothetical protein